VSSRTWCRLLDLESLCCHVRQARLQQQYGSAQYVDMASGFREAQSLKNRVLEVYQVHRAGLHHLSREALKHQQDHEYRTVLLAYR